MHKILVKYWKKLHIHEHFLPIFLINVINILAKTIQYKEVEELKCESNLKTECPIAFKPVLISVLRLS